MLQGHHKKRSLVKMFFSGWWILCFEFSISIKLIIRSSYYCFKCIYPYYKTLFYKIIKLEIISKNWFLGCFNYFTPYICVWTIVTAYYNQIYYLRETETNPCWSVYLAMLGSCSQLFTSTIDFTQSLVGLSILGLYAQY